jgi:SSS family solute:Na+ symporter
MVDISGLVFIGIPIAYHAVGVMMPLKQHLDPKYLSLTNVHWYQLNWSVTIIPIWFVE